MNKTVTILKTIIRIGIGAFFIVSAILKLLSIDQFELYIYSFNIVGFTLSGLVARAIIAAEILLGLLLIVKVKYKAAWWLTLLMLIGFSFLLVYVILFRNDSNCHCMGDLVEIKPSLSLIKNLVAIALMLCIRKEEDYHFRGRVAVLVVAILAAIVPPFILFPVDNIYNLIYKTDNLNYNETEFNALMADSTMQGVSFEKGNYIVGVVASGCEFCHTGGLKLSEIVSNNQLDSNRVVYLIWGDSTSIRQFQTETKSDSFRFIQISPVRAIHIVNGQFPTFLLMHDGDVQSTADLHHLTEKTVISHLQ
jgi:uncharacterized membrane protein YphA (DoxX/SURF4 family)